MMDAAEPDYKALDDRALADAYGVAEKQAKAEAKRFEALKAELVRRDKRQYLGTTYTVVRNDAEQLRFDAKSARAEMGEAWYDKHKKAVATVGWIISLSDVTTAALAALTPAARKRRKTAPAA